MFGKDLLRKIEVKSEEKIPPNESTRPFAVPLNSPFNDWGVRMCRCRCMCAYQFANDADRNKTGGRCAH